MRDFASFLDETAARRPSGPGPAAPAFPAMPFGFVGRGVGLAAEDASRADAAKAYLELPEPEAEAGPPEATPEAVARELALDGVLDAKALDRARRAFAFSNHPDRVRAEWRKHAMARMQIANRMIDEAKRRLTAQG